MIVRILFQIVNLNVSEMQTKNKKTCSHEKKQFTADNNTIASFVKKDIPSLYKDFNSAQHKKEH